MKKIVAIGILDSKKFSIKNNSSVQFYGILELAHLRKDHNLKELFWI